MSQKMITVKVFRQDPEAGTGPSFDTFAVPWQPGLSAMDVLDYIYQNLDSTLAYYDHAGCALGICARCTGKINGKAGLLCQTLVEGDLVLEPTSTERVVKDLVVDRGGK
jgi:succinate dehydrogenase/fumarate reductase-like Fe-S protein